MAIRKTGRATSLLARPMIGGVLVPDPGGTPTVIPFTGSTTDALRGDGTFGPVAADVTTGLNALWDETLGAYVVPR
jgi:hypothetical protein